MQNNNSSLNTVLLVIVIILLIIGIWFVARRDTATIIPVDINQRQIETGADEDRSASNTTTTVPTSSTSGTSTTVQQTTQTTTQTQSSMKVSPKFGLKYPAGAQISESYYLTPGQTANGVPENQGASQATITISNMVISWGSHQGACSPDEFGSFRYGISTTACVKGMRAQAGVEDVRYALTQREISIFGDFVLANR